LPGEGRQHHRLAAHHAATCSADSPTAVQPLAKRQWAIGYVLVEWGIPLGRSYRDESTML